MEEKMETSDRKNRKIRIRNKIEKEKKETKERRNTYSSLSTIVHNI
jgi:hypothetical protein